MNHDNIKGEAVSALRDQLKDSLIEFEKRRKAARPQQELNVLYQAIKKLRIRLEHLQAEIIKR